MAFRPNQLNNFTAPSAAYPQGSAKDETAPGANNGSEYKLARADDVFGLHQALLKMASIVASGNPDSALNKTSSQYLQAILHAILSARTFTDSGAADAYVLTAINDNPAPDSYQSNMSFEFFATNSNTGASTVNIEGLGIKNIFAEGAALIVGDIIAGESVHIQFDAPNDRFNIHTHLLGRASAIDLTIAGDAASPPDANTLVKDNIVKGWVSFEGIGVVSINDSYNVSGIVDNGTGNYTVTFDRDFDNTDYCTTVSVEAQGGVNMYPELGPHAVGSIDFIVLRRDNGTFVNCATACLIAIGDQA